MRPPRRARDVQLLDALDSSPREPFEGEAWRIVRDGRDPLQGYPVGARWDPPDGFDVIYTALHPDGARAEVFFHLSRAPVFPSRTVFLLHRIAVVTQRTLRLTDKSGLAALGVDMERFAEIDYRNLPTRTQEIGDAAYFLGFDSMIVPSARAENDNLVLFVDRLNIDRDLAVRESTTVDWHSWRRRSSH